MGAPFGDYVLSSYTVACDRGEILMRAERQVPGEPRVTELVFSGVVAYELELDTLRTVLGYVLEEPLDAFLRTHEARLAHGARESGWAPFLKPTIGETTSALEAAGIHAFAISSAIGMRGWVLARAFTTRCA